MNSNITGVILAGGLGTRLMPLTQTTSKQLLPLGGKSMIVRVIEKMKLAGIVSIVIVIDERHASQYFSEVKDGSDFGVEVVYVWQSRGGGGMPSAIIQAKKAVRNDKILVACGDVMVDQTLNELVDKFNQIESGAAIVYTRTTDTAGYSALSISNGLVQDILKKDTTIHEEGVIDIGMYFYTKEVFDKISHLKVSDRGETEIWDLNKMYVIENQLHALELHGWWSDTGSSIKDYLLADEHFYEKSN